LSYGAGELGQWAVAHPVKGCKYSIKLRRTGKKLTSSEAAEKAAGGVSYVGAAALFVNFSGDVFDEGFGEEPGEGGADLIDEAGDDFGFAGKHGAGGEGGDVFG
jgi:hypothetical protein